MTIPGVKWRMPGYLILAALFLYGFGKWQGRQGQESAQIIRSAHQALQSGNAYRIRQARLATLAQAQADTALRYRRQSQIRAGLITQLDTTLSRASTAADSLGIYRQQTVVLREQVIGLTIEATRFEVAWRIVTSQRDSAEARIAVLERNLSATLTIADCHIAGVKFFPRCPSRLASGLIGIGTGALAILVLKH